ncbi:MAG: right-handed parallel beta-helix repeat-containing protein [Nitrospirota bacterium]
MHDPHADADDRESPSATPELAAADRGDPLTPPPNPAGGRTLIVDGNDPSCYPRPSAALADAAADDQVFVRPGRYEDKIFMVGGPARLIGAGRDLVEIFSRRTGPLYLQRLPSGLISDLTFRYVGSDQHSAVNVLDSTCTISRCRITDGVLSGIVIYGPESRPTLVDNEVCRNRESGIFVFAGATPYLTRNDCFDNHHFGIAVRDPGTKPDVVRNGCRGNRLSGILLFHHAHALLLDNVVRDNDHWGLVLTPDCATTPPHDELTTANSLASNPRGALTVTDAPLADIGR